MIWGHRCTRWEHVPCQPHQYVFWSFIAEHLITIPPDFHAVVVTSRSLTTVNAMHVMPEKAILEIGGQLPPEMSHFDGRIPTT